MPVNDDIAEVRETQATQGERVAVLEGSNAELRSGLQSVRSDVAQLRADVGQAVRDAVAPLHSLLRWQLGAVVLAMLVVAALVGVRVLLDSGGKVEVSGPPAGVAASR